MSVEMVLCSRSVVWVILSGTEGVVQERRSPVLVPAVIPLCRESLSFRSPTYESLYAPSRLIIGSWNDFWWTFALAGR